MIATVATSSDKTRQRGHTLSTLSLTAYRLPFGFLFVSIVTWPILPHHPTPTCVCVCVCVPDGGRSGVGGEGGGQGMGGRAAIESRGNLLNVFDVRSNK